MSVLKLSTSLNRLVSLGCRECRLSGWKESRIPSKEECEALWTRFAVSEEVVVHSRMVSELARILAIYLNQAGSTLNLDLIVACGHLHELADGELDSVAARRKILDEAGYRCVSDIVASRMDTRPGKASPDEADLIHLAHMLLENDRLVTLEEQCSRLVASLAGRPRALKLAERRLRDAERIKRHIEAVLDIPLEEIIQRHKRGIQAVSREGKRLIYLVSHGAVRAQRSEEPLIPQWSSPLSEEGIRQARALEAKLGSTRFSAIYCSDIRCARETAEIIGKPHGLPPKEREDLREIALEKAQSGESLMEGTLRVIPALYAILHCTRGNVLIVGHPWLNRIILSQALGRPLENLFEIRQTHGCLNVIQYSNFAFDVRVLNEIGLAAEPGKR